MQFRDRDFTDEDVTLDGNTFTGCTFRNCQMIYGGTAGCDIGGNSFYDVRWRLSGAAANTVKFLTAMYASDEGGRKVVESLLAQIRGESP